MAPSGSALTADTLTALRTDGYPREVRLDASANGDAPRAALAISGSRLPFAPSYTADAPKKAVALLTR